MEDQQIIELYFARKEEAITQTKTKYGRYCHSIAYNILRNDEDAEECVNDTYLDAWESIPPHKPKVFSVFLGTITRRISLDKYLFPSTILEHNTTQHNTTQHIEETLSTIHLSGTRPVRNFSYEKFPAGLFLFKSFFRGYFPVCVIA